MQLLSCKLLLSLPLFENNSEKLQQMDDLKIYLIFFMFVE